MPLRLGGVRVFGSTRHIHHNAPTVPEVGKASMASQQPDAAVEKDAMNYNTQFCMISSENNTQSTVDESSFVRPSLLKPVAPRAKQQSDSDGFSGMIKAASNIAPHPTSINNGSTYLSASQAEPKQIPSEHTFARRDARHMGEADRKVQHDPAAAGMHSPDVKLEVNVKMAKNLPNIPAPFGDSKIGLRQPNTFVSVAFDGQHHKSDVKLANCNPEWDCNFAFPCQHLLSAQGKALKIGDPDTKCQVEVWMQKDQLFPGGAKQARGEMYHAVGKWFTLGNPATACSMSTFRSDNAPQICISFGWVQVERKATVVGGVGTESESQIKDKGTMGPKDNNSNQDDFFCGNNSAKELGVKSRIADVYSGRDRDFAEEAGSCNGKSRPNHSDCLSSLDTSAVNLFPKFNAGAVDLGIKNIHGLASNECGGKKWRESKVAKGTENLLEGNDKALLNDSTVPKRKSSVAAMRLCIQNPNDMHTKHRNGVALEKAAESPIGWFSELISEISDILSPEDFSQHRRSDQSRERSVPGIDTPSSTFIKIKQKDSFAELQKRKTVVVGRHSTIKRKDEPDELRKLCGTWSGEIERCCTSCIIGRQRVADHFSEDSGSLGLALLPNYQKGTMVVIGLEYGGPAERCGRISLGDELVLIGSHTLESLLASDEGEVSVHRLLNGSAGTSVTLTFRRTEAGYSAANERCYPCNVTTDSQVVLTRGRRREVSKGGKHHKVPSAAEHKVESHSQGSQMIDMLQSSVEGTNVPGTGPTISSDCTGDITSKMNQTNLTKRPVPRCSLHDLSETDTSSDVSSDVSSPWTSNILDAETGDIHGNKRPQAVPALWRPGGTPRYK